MVRLGRVAVLGGAQGSAHVADDAVVLGAALAQSAATVLTTGLPAGVSTWWVSAGQMAVGGWSCSSCRWSCTNASPSDLAAADWGWFRWLTAPGTAGGFGLWLVGLRMGG